MAYTEDVIHSTLLASITEEDFKAFLSEKVKVHACPCCQTNAWGILGSNEFGLGIIAFQKNAGFTVPPPHVPVFGVSCNTCGYIRLHATGMIAQWKAAKAVAK